jgi:muramoyltetrapeptide carboxypeptidase
VGVTRASSRPTRPRALRPGDGVALVAPASPFAREEFDAGVEELAALGFVPVYDERVFARRGYVAGDAALRAASFMDAIADPSVGAVMAVRGGYGSTQILARIDAGAVARARKPVVGYSDITSLLTWVVQAAGLVAFHGPMIDRRLSRGASGYDRASFLGMLTSPHPYGVLATPGAETLRAGEARGRLAGGTLTQLVASLGTPFAFNPPDGCVVFLDEVGERPYRLDRMLTQLRLNGALSRAGAIVFNELPGCDEAGGTPAAVDAVREALDGFTGPIVRGVPSGHTSRAQLTLPLGVEVVVDARGPQPTLVFEEAAVAAG